jgi:hypothetical protein
MLRSLSCHPRPGGVQVATPPVFRPSSAFLRRSSSTFVRDVFNTFPPNGFSSGRTLSKFTSRRLGNAAAVHPPGAYFRMLRGPVTECNHQSRLGLRCMRFFRLPAETCRFSISDAATTSPVSCFKIPPAVEARRAAVERRTFTASLSCPAHTRLALRYRCPRCDTRFAGTAQAQTRLLEIRAERNRGPLGCKKCGEREGLSGAST